MAEDSENSPRTFLISHYIVLPGAGNTRMLRARILGGDAKTVIDHDTRKWGDEALDCGDIFGLVWHLSENKIIYRDEDIIRREGLDIGSYNKDILELVAKARGRTGPPLYIPTPEGEMAAGDYRNGYYYALPGRGMSVFRDMFYAASRGRNQFGYSRTDSKDLL